LNKGKVKKKILIVDDLAENLRLLSEALAGRGYEVRGTKSGAMALMMVGQYQPDLILLDIKLPDLDGYQICQKLKANAITKEIPIIFCTVLDSACDKVKAFTAGGSDYIIKPFQISEVIARIENQLALVETKAKINRLDTFFQEKLQHKTREIEQEITKRVRVENQEVQIKQTQVESILNCLRIVVFSLQLESGKLIYLNSAVEQVYNRPQSDFWQDSQMWLKVIDRKDRQRVEEFLLQLESGKNIEIEYRIVRPEGKIVWVKDRRSVIEDPQTKLAIINGTISEIMTIK